MEIKINKVFNVNVTGQENEGLGVAKIGDLVIFIENGLKGDTGDIKVTEMKKNFARGKMLFFDNVSDERQDAPCPYYTECGGCNVQHQKYHDQLNFKMNKVKNALERIGKFNNLKINDIMFDQELFYRNKVMLKVNKDKMGFYKKNSNDIIDIDKCLISNNDINNTILVLKSFIKEYQDNTFESIMIRSGHNIMIDIKALDNDLKDKLKEYIIKHLNNIGSLFLNDELLYGDEYINVNLKDYTFKLSRESFYQVNNKIMDKLYDKVIEYSSSIQNNTILDLYCGIGSITSLLSNISKRVIGVEVVKDAIDNAKENALINNINNVVYQEGKVEKVLQDLSDEEVDTVVLDPPRQGVDKRVIDMLIKINPKQIVYVSCDPVTLARDIRLLCDNNYELIEVTPFDMFPQTSHVETVALISRV